MKFWGIFRFEMSYQLRRGWPWLFFVVLLVLCFLMARDGALAEALYDEFFANSPFAIAKTMVFGTLLWLLVAPAVAGEAAARDVGTGMHPLVYTSPIAKTEYLGGRFLAALVLNALILLAVPAAIMLAIYLPGVDAALIGPFRPAAYLTAYAFVALPNAFVATAIQFSFASRTGRAMAGYVGSMLLVFMGFFVASLLLFGRPLGKLLDPIGVRFIMEDLSHLWTTYEKSWRLLELEGTMLNNRLLWIVVGVAALALTWLRFRFAHRTAAGWRPRWPGRGYAHAPVAATVGRASSTAVAVPIVARSFGPAIQVQKTLAIAWTSFRSIAWSLPGLALLVGIPLLMVPVVLDQTMSAGIPLTPSTALVIRQFTGSLSDELSRWIIVPLAIVFFAGEQVWRERDAGIGEITDAMPGTEWAPFIGKFLGLALVLTLLMLMLTAAGMAAQALRGYHDFEVGLYLKILLGLQLPDYLLFALLALAVHVLVNHKYAGHLAGVLVYVFILVLAGMLGVEHNLLVYGAGPSWSYTEMRGFGSSIAPWLWFKLYWAAWALLLAAAARAFWVRGREQRLGVRLRLARHRLGGSTAVVAGAAAALIVTLGGFIFYNTNVRNEYLGSTAIAERRAEYERRYRRFETIAQPTVTATNLRVEIYPDRRSVDVRGSYRIVNSGTEPIDSILVATAAGAAETRTVTFDRSTTLAVNDADHGARVYALTAPLQPGDSMLLDFVLHAEPRGFGESGADDAVTANGSSFTSREWFPRIGYQQDRALIHAADRREHGLEPRPIIASLYDVQGGKPATRGGGIAFDAVVGTNNDQVAVAPGDLKRTWTEGGRRYFHYRTSAPIGSEWAFFSAHYAMEEARWKDVAIRIFHHPDHAGAHVKRMVQAVRAALEYYSAQLGPYPYNHLTVAEMPGGPGAGMHAEPAFISHGESFAYWIPKGEHTLDFPYAVIAHEMAHQWTLASAPVEGAPFLSEGLAWYASIQAVKASRGADEARRLLSTMREPRIRPEIRRGEPLLRALDPYMSYRKGPFAMYALSEYIGTDQVNGALRRLIAKHDVRGAPLATTLDLHRELKAITPDALGYLLHDLFEVNTYWQLQTDQARAKQNADGTWRVTLDVSARKVMFDSKGVETVLPMNEWIEIGIFESGGESGELSAPLHVQRHRIRSGKQKLEVTVARRPVLAGIDPFHVLDWEERDDDDNIAQVKSAEGTVQAPSQRIFRAKNAKVREAREGHPDGPRSLRPVQPHFCCSTTETGRLVDRDGSAGPAAPQPPA